MIPLHRFANSRYAETCCIGHVRLPINDISIRNEIVFAYISAIREFVSLFPKQPQFPSHDVIPLMEIVAGDYGNTIVPKHLSNVETGIGINRDFATRENALKAIDDVLKEYEHTKAILDPSRNQIDYGDIVWGKEFTSLSLGNIERRIAIDNMKEKSKELHRNLMEAIEKVISSPSLEYIANRLMDFFNLSTGGIKFGIRIDEYPNHPIYGTIFKGTPQVALEFKPMTKKGPERPIHVADEVILVYPKPDTELLLCNAVDPIKIKLEKVVEKYQIPVQ